MRPRAPARFARLAALAIVAWLAALAPAQSVPAAGDADEDGAGAWLVLPSEAGWAALAHLPPRTAGGEDGQIRWVRRLDRTPEALAAADSWVYLFFPPLEGEGSRRRVASLSTGLREGRWVEKPVGRLLVQRSLPPAERLIDAGASDYTALALIEVEGAPRLLRAPPGYTAAWQELPLPELAAGSQRRLVAGDAARLLEVREGEPPVLWTRENTSPFQTGAASQEGWTWTARPLPVVIEGELAAAFEGPTGLVLATRRGGRLRLEIIGEVQSRPLGEVEVGEREVAIAPLAADDRVAIVVMPEREEAEQAPEAERPAADGPSGEADADEPADAADPPSRARRQAEPPRIVELSLLSGRVLYDGTARFPMPVTRTDLRALGAAMLLVVMLVLAFLLGREAGEDGVELPEGYAIVEDGRRVSAGLLDLFIAAWLSSLATGTSLWTALGAGLWTEGEPLAPLLVTFALAFVLCTLAEASTGRSPGKALAGCRVVAAGRGERAPGPWRALVRNACKWGVPPLALMAFLDADRRHRGDSLAGTVVVSRMEEEDDGDAEDDSEGE